jgi:hypothetical protein
MMWIIHGYHPYPQEFIHHPWIFIQMHPDASMVVPISMMAEEDKDESSHVNMDQTNKEVQDTCPAFDNDLDSEVNNFTIEEDDHVFMAMVHLFDPHYFVHASSMVSRRLAEVFAKNSKLKGFEDIVPTSLHIYADVFSETAFDSLPEHHKWDHTI